jgi:adenosylmethionine-8-amino-7-oxononanoate aminotransferase
MTTADGRPSFLRAFSRPGFDDGVTIVRGEGAIVWDDQGNRYVDALASLWYNQVGHGRAEIADAVREQMVTLAGFQTFDMWTNEPAERLAARIAALSPLDDPRVFLCGSGSESVDSAIKISRQSHARAGHPERQIVISRDRAYHGTNFGGTSAQGLPPNKEGWGELLPGFVQIDKHDLEAKARFFAEHGREVAAVLVEPVQGAGGVHPPEPGYLEGLRRLCDDHGAHLIFDEVICGFGRLGAWFGAERFGVTPDLLTFAKGVTSGYLPLGGVIVGSGVRAPLEADPDWIFRHGYTYSGHPTVCTAALVNIDIIEREGLVARANVVGARLAEGLQALVADGLLASARGEGAVWAAVPPEGTDVMALRDRLRAGGVISRALPPDAVVFCPPLVIEDEQLDETLDVLAAALTPT